MKFCEECVVKRIDITLKDAVKYGLLCKCNKYNLN